MKFTLKIGVVATALFTTTGYALDPVQGFYGGVMIGGSLASSMQFDFTHPINKTLPSLSDQLKYSAYGNIAGDIGYRFNQFRLETELLFNNSPYHTITVNGIDFIARKKKQKKAGFSYKGQTTTGALMVNGFFDIYLDGTDTNFVPFIGLGLGYANVHNSVKLYCDGKSVGNNIVIIAPSGDCTLVANPTGRRANLSKNHDAGAAQAIIGINYFMDDYLTFGLDLRQFGTKKIPPFNSRTQFTSINLTFNGAFDFG